MSDTMPQRGTTERLRRGPPRLSQRAVRRVPRPGGPGLDSPAQHVLCALALLRALCVAVSPRVRYFLLPVRMRVVCVRQPNCPRPPPAAALECADPDAPALRVLAAGRPLPPSRRHGQAASAHRGGRGCTCSRAHPCADQGVASASSLPGSHRTYVPPPVGCGASPGASHAESGASA